MLDSRSIRWTLVLALGIFTPPDAIAKKCGYAHYVVEGSVVGADGRAIPDAQVGVAWTDGELPAGPALTRTDIEGRYSVTLWVTTLCGKAPAYLSLSSYTDTHRSEAMLIGVGQSPDVAAPPLRITEPLK